MEHLAGEYGPVDIPVPLVTEQSHCAPLGSPADFYEFPKKNGWTVGEDYTLNETKEGVRLDKADLLQSWLFFGLISLVVRDGNGPILTFEQLVDHSNSRSLYVDTTRLPQALLSWERWEQSHEETAKVRMVRAELVLKDARGIVRKNCAFDIEDSEVAQPGTNEPDLLSEELSLSLMVLGETLSAAKARIILASGAQMKGWYEDDEGGWGPPGYVLRRMKDRKWCPNAIHLLQGQLGSNAILLLAAFESHKTLDMTNAHIIKGCTNDSCMVISEDDEVENTREGISVYRPKHESRCTRNNCQLVGPKMAEVYQILNELNEQHEDKRNQKFPILEVREKQDRTLEVVVRAWTSDQDIPFATISHVWSDGLGNEDTNKIYHCQLKFIRSLLDKVVRASSGESGSRMSTIPFWMDTLLIPVRSNEADPATPDNFNDLKKTAIRQIFHVFNASAHSIVIDKGLLEIDARGTPWKNVMKILASGWMRRLWTLQEAYLSKQLWITFKQSQYQHTGMENIDELISSMPRAEAFSSSIAEMGRLKLSQNIMGFERNQRKRDESPRGAIMVANTWRAARWRTTSNPAHETLALATLLNLDYSGTTINQAVLAHRKDKVTKDELENMMSDFWKTLHRLRPGSIPPGIIFLAGEKLSKVGFRWAPKTWMSALETDHPDPLSSFNCTTELDDESGLLVQYPGFLLHCQDRKVILGTDSVVPAFIFPIDKDLLEWYSAEPADKDSKAYIYQILDQQNGKSSELAIILSRSRPREMPSEIGLLVEIYEKRPRQREGDLRRTVYCCRIIHRVRAWRAEPKYQTGYSINGDGFGMQRRPNTTQSATGSHPSILQGPSEKDNQICFGELIDSDQQWFVDAYEPPPKASVGDDIPDEQSTDIPADAGTSSTAATVGENGGSRLSQIIGTRRSIFEMLWRKN